MVLDKKNTIAFRINAAGQNQDSWQDQGYTKSYIIAPSLLYKPNEKLSVSLEAEILQSVGNSNGGNHVFLLTPTFINQNLSSALTAMGYPSAMVNAMMAGAPKTFEEAYGTNRADKLKLDYDRSYLNDDMHFTTKNTSLFGTVDYKFSDHWTSQTSITYSRSSNSGYMGYQYLLPNYLVNFISSLYTGTPSFGEAGHDSLARMVWKPGGSVSNYEIQQNFVSDYSFGNQMRNRAVIGLDFSNYNSDIVYERFYGSLLGLAFPDVFDVVPSHGNVPNYGDFNLTNVNAAFTENLSATLPYQYNNNIYSAFINDVFNINEYIILNAGLRLDHFQRTDKYGQESYNQTKLAPKFGVVVSPIKEALAVDFRAKFKRQNLDWHNVLGLYSSPVVILLSVTGIAITFSTFYVAFLFMFTGNSPQSVAQIFDQHVEAKKKGEKALSVQQIAKIGKDLFQIPSSWESIFRKIKTIRTDWI